jgi:hypothetical protein
MDFIFSQVYFHKGNILGEEKLITSSLNICLEACSPTHRSMTGGYSRLWHKVVVPARQATWLAGRYDNPMPESTLSPSQGPMNSATAVLRGKGGSS